MTGYDVAIIGAGVVGCSTAYALSKQGIRTMNIDALPAAGYGSTSASSAIVRPMYSHWVSTALAHESQTIWQNWQDFLDAPDDEPVAHYRQTGGLMLIKQGELALVEPMMAAMREVGVAFEVIEADQIRRLLPGISLASYGPPKPMSDAAFCQPTEGDISHAIQVPAVGYVSDPQLAARNLYDAARRLGGKFEFNRKVIGIDHSQGQFEVSTQQGEIIADKLVNAAGPHSSQINSLAGIDLPIETKPLRHEVSYLRRDIQHFQQQPMLVLDTDAGVYQRPEGADDMLIGTTDPACDEEEVVDPDSLDMNLTDKWTRQVMRAAQRFPDYRIPNQARGTVGVYDASNDWIPIYDRTDLPGYYVAIGTSGNQFKNAPLIGEVMAAIINADDHDHAPARLHLPQVGRHIDLSFFSRNRIIQATRGVLA